MPRGQAVCQEPLRLRPAGRWPWPEPALSRSDHGMTDGMCAPITGLRPCTRPMAGARTALRATRPAPPAGQGNRLKPGVGPGRDLPGSRAGAVPNWSRYPARRSPAPFLSLMIRTNGAGNGLAGATAGAGGDINVNAK
jgi:hypothetical protein